MVFARRDDEQGAVAIIVGVSSMLIFVLIAAFAVDLGTQRVGRRDMQSLADVVALDLSRLLDGRTKSAIESSSEWTSTRVNSVAQNDDFAVGDNLNVVAVLGELDTSGVFVPLGSGQGAAVPSAVEVTAAVVVDRSFLPGSGGAVRSAVGANEKTACFQLGSYAAAIKTGDSTLLGPLNGLLGLNLQAVSYQGLANGQLSVDELVATGQLGTTDQVLGGQVTLGQLYNASLTALQNQGPTASVTNAAAIAGIQALIAQNVNQNTQVNLGNVLNIDSGDGAALATQFNVLNTLTGAALIANGTNAIALNNVGVGIPGVGAINSSLSLIERARLACGTVPGNPAAALATCASSSAPVPRGCAQNSQVRGNVAIPLNLLNTGVLGLSVTGTSQLAIDLGNASGVLNIPEPTCVEGTAANPDKLNVLVNTSLATASLSNQLKVRQVFPVNLGLLGSPSVIIEFDVSVTSAIPNPAGNTNAPLVVPPNDQTPVPGGSDAILGTPVIGTATNVVIKVDTNGNGVGVLLSSTGVLLQAAVTALVPGLLSTATSQVANVVVPDLISPLINNINSQILAPISKLVGLNIAGADVYGVGRPTCQTPKLAG